jgi:hypothetical protein
MIIEHGGLLLRVNFYPANLSKDTQIMAHIPVVQTALFA